jgi:hypothetical protein
VSRNYSQKRKKALSQSHQLFSKIYKLKVIINFLKLYIGTTLDAIDRFNDKARKVLNDNALVSCQHCARTFFPDRLEMHLRSCGKSKSKSSSITVKIVNKTSPYDPPKPNSRMTQNRAKSTKNNISHIPKVPRCELCGSKSGKANIKNNEITCENKPVSKNQKEPSPKNSLAIDEIKNGNDLNGIHRNADKSLQKTT